MIKSLFTLVILITLSFQGISQDYSLYLSNETSFEREPIKESDVKANLTSLSELNGTRYGLIQFKDLPNADEKNELAKGGIELTDYMPGNAYYARISEGFTVFNAANIRFVLDIEPKHKLDKELLKTPYPVHAVEGGFIELNVSLISEKDQGVFIEKLDELGGELVFLDKHINTVKCKVPTSKLSVLTDLPMVQFVLPKDEPGEPENFKGRASHRIDALTKSYTGLSTELDGSGMNVMLQDDGVIGPHIDYQGRIGAQFISTDRGDHGDHTGGTIMGAGNLHPRYKGMAPASVLWVYGAASEGYPGFDSIYNHYNDYDIRITSTSYSNGTNAGYTALARKLDDQTEQMNDLIHVFSAGNAGSGWNTITGGHKVAKNVITVANLATVDAIASSSSRGPAKDGRIKPDIGAVGSNVISTTTGNQYVAKTGTSMSCPGVAGTITVLSQAYKNYNNDDYPVVSLMKGIVCNTADDLGNPGPDFSYGFGRINAKKAFDAIKNKTYFSGTVANGATETFTLRIDPNTTLSKVMLVWLDPQGTVGATRPLINNLDLTVTDPSSNISQPLILNPTSPANNAVQGVDQINNIEQVVLDQPLPGNYTISVKGTSIPSGPQAFYVVYTAENESIQVEYPVGGESLVPGETETIRWSAPSNYGPFDIEYTLDNGANWTVVASGTPFKIFNWTVPNTNSAQAKIRVSANGLSGESSSSFSILRAPSTPSIIKACPGEVTLSWNAVDSAVRYVVYELGEKYMDSIGTTSNTTFDIVNDCIGFKEGWFAVAARGINGEIGRRSEAYLKTGGRLINCPISKDVGVVSISPNISDVKSCFKPNGVEIELDIENTGSTFSPPFTAFASVNGGVPVQEMFSTPLNPGGTATVTFTQPLILASGNNDVQVWISSVVDENSCNDSMLTTSFYDVNVIENCSITDFENFANCGTASNCDEEICDLTDGWVNATNGENDDIDWRVHNGATPTNNTGPTVDHTMGNADGKYVYIESSLGQTGCNNKEAALLSPCVDLTNFIKPKLSFWYYMRGGNVGSINVDIFYQGSWVNSIMPTISGNKGSRWIEQVIDLSNYKNGVVQFRLKGKTTSGFNGDIAIDDIGILDTIIADFSTSQRGLVVDFNNTSSNTKGAAWYFGDGNFSNAESPVHEYKTEGVYTVKLIVNNDCGIDSITKTIDVVANGITIKPESIGLNVFPMPAKNELNVTADVEISELQIIDLSGKAILVKNTLDTQKAIINLEGISNGVYILEVKVGDSLYRKKIEITE